MGLDTFFYWFGLALGTSHILKLNWFDLALSCKSEDSIVLIIAVQFCSLYILFIPNLQLLVNIGSLYLSYFVRAILAEYSGAVLGVLSAVLYGRRGHVWKKVVFLVMVSSSVDYTFLDCFNISFDHSS